MKTNTEHPQLLVLLAMIAPPLAVYFRLIDLDVLSPDGYTMSRWLFFIRTHGLGTAYGTQFYSYTPIYPYFLGLFNNLFPGMDLLHAPKYLAFLGEIICALWVYRLLRLDYPKPSAIPGGVALGLCITPVFINDSARQGQCDAWLLAFLLPMFYYILKQRPSAAMLCYALTVAFKPQAIFFFPCLLVCLLTGAISWKKLWIIPAVYLAVCVPCLLEGRSLMNLLDIYPHQIVIDHVHSYTVANIYYYFDEHSPATAIAGIVLTIILSCYFAWLTAKSNRELNMVQWLLLATFFATLVPFLLPKMYDRYFFMAATLAFILAFLRPRWAFLAVLLQCAFMLASTMENFNWLQDYTYIRPRAIAVLLNLAALVWLTRLCYQNIWTRNPASWTNASAIVSQPT